MNKATFQESIHVDMLFVLFFCLYSHAAGLGKELVPFVHLWNPTLCSSLFLIYTEVLISLQPENSNEPRERK